LYNFDALFLIHFQWFITIQKCGAGKFFLCSYAHLYLFDQKYSKMVNLWNISI